LYAYNVKDINEPLLPPWTLIQPRTSGTHGFAYAVFRNTSTNEVVIAYRGSDDAADWSTNAGMIIAQERQAAAVYTQVLRDHGSDAQGSNISLTGHSLGGGLAATMAVWFNRPAVVFDPAPTQGIATDLSVVNSVIGTLGGLAPQSIRDYAAALPAQFAARETKVTSYYAPGSPVYAISTADNTITGPGQGNPVQFGIDNMGSVGGRVNMHSQALLTAGVLTPAFAQATIAAQRTLPVVFDKAFYNLRADGAERNFLLDLIRSEQANPGIGKLTHFASDLNKLGANIAGLNKQAQDALIAQGIEWYYWQGTDYAGQEFFTQTGNLLQYTTAKGDGLAGAQNKALSYVGKWLTPIVNDHGEFYSASFSTYDQWNVATGGSGASLTALASSKSQIFIGGAGGDTFTGGDLGDVLVGDVGNDAIAGGASDDILLGGSGDDNIWGDLETSLINQDWAITRSVTTQGNTTIYTLNYSGVFANAQSGGGDDAIFAGAGVVWVMAEDGDDYIDGGAGDDVLFGERGRDDLFGGTGTSRFKSNAREQRSCRTRKKVLRGHVPGHASSLPRASGNEALQ
ncbi:MAG: DUF2974 domain-containing protein, partial [Burkholderiales bacterium]|nr:DUF2974 domain-containing protein [Burkholderiales bacterium]